MRDYAQLHTADIPPEFVNNLFCRGQSLAQVFEDRLVYAFELFWNIVETKINTR